MTGDLSRLAMRVVVSAISRTRTHGTRAAEARDILRNPLGGFPMTFKADAPSVSRAPVRSLAAHDRLFYGTMAVILAVIVFAGFFLTS